MGSLRIYFIRAILVALAWSSVIINLCFVGLNNRKKHSKDREIVAKRPRIPTRHLGTSPEPVHIEPANRKVSISSPPKAHDESMTKHKQSWSYQQSTTIPPWMKEYFNWHRQERAKLNQNTESWQSFRFLVVRCLSTDMKCGGTADRLKPLPFYIMAAARMKRLLIIHWERPCQLIEFLQPLDDSGIDWSFPLSLRHQAHELLASTNAHRLQTIQHLRPYLGDIPDTKGTSSIPSLSSLKRGKFSKALDVPFISLIFQSFDHGESFYNDLRFDQDEEPSYADVFRDTWRSVFIPSDPVQQRIEKSMQDLGLIRDDFVALHIRSQYHSAISSKQQAFLVHNAVHCASILMQRKDQIMFIATDAVDVTKDAVSYAKSKGAVGVSQSHSTLYAPLHLDRGENFLSKEPSNWTSHTPVDYYDTFVDLYLLAAAQCTAVNVGNFGKWANLMSSNHTCRINHLAKTCRWKAIK